MINCYKYAYKQWKDIEEIIGHSLLRDAGEPGSITLNYINIIYNKDPKITGRYKKDKTIEQTVRQIIQEQKRDIYYRAQNTTGEINNYQRIAHIKTLFKKIKNFLEYRGGGLEKNVQEFFTAAEAKIEEKIQATTAD